MTHSHIKFYSIFAVVTIVIFGLVAFFFFVPHAATQNISGKNNYKIISVNFRNTVVRADVSDTEAKQTLGLSYRKDLPEGSGMWFDFLKDVNWGFWMKDMNFSIDMIWFDKDFSVIYIKENATPESYPAFFGPEKPYRYVLEVPSGFVKRYSVFVGDSVILK